MDVSFTTRQVRWLGPLVPLVFGTFGLWWPAMSRTVPAAPVSSNSIAFVKGLAAKNPDQSTATPVVVKGVVTALSGWRDSFFLQDATGGVSVNQSDHTDVQPGERVTVTGTLAPGLFAPVIAANKVTVTGKAPLPKPVEASADLADGHLDSTRIQVSGVVHSGQLATIWGRRVLLLNLEQQGEPISVHILDFQGLNVASLVDSKVTVRGVCGTRFNDRRQIIGVRLFVPDPSGLTIDEPAPDPEKLPLYELSGAQRYDAGPAPIHRVRLSGTVTYRSAEHGIYIQQNGEGVHVAAAHPEQFSPGQSVIAVGFVKKVGYSLGLADAQLKVVKTGASPQPVQVTADKVIALLHGFPVAPYDGLLVRLTASVVEQLPGSQNQIWLLRQANSMFQAELSGPATAGQTAFEPRSEVQLTGICMAELDENGNPASFRILLRSPDDIVVANSPGWEQSFVFLSGGFAILMLVALLVWAFGKRYASQAVRQLTTGRPTRLSSRLRLTARVLAFSVFITVFASLFSWYARTDTPVAARVTILFASLSLGWNQSSKWAQRLASGVIAAALTILGVAVLWHYRTHLVSPGLDPTLSLVSRAGITVAGGLCCGVLGLSLLLFRHRKLYPIAQVLSLAVAALCLLNVITRVYGASTTYGIARHTMLPLFAALCLLALAVAALFLQPDQGIMSPITSSGNGGIVTRRLIPAVLFISIFLGWLRLEGQTNGMYDSVFGLSLLALSNCLAFGCILWINSTLLEHLDRARLRVEEVLRQRDQQLELLFEESGVGDYTWDIRTDQVDAHPVFWQLCGVREVQGRGSSQLLRSRILPEDLSLFDDRVRTAIQTASRLDVDFRIARQELGQVVAVRWLNLRGRVSCDERGQPAQIRGINMDITARKLADGALRATTEAAYEADRRFKLGLNFAKIASWTWLSDSDSTTWAGPVEEVLGRNAQDLNSFGAFVSFVHPDDRPLLESTISATLTGGSDFKFEFRFVVDGGIRWIAARGGALKDASGRIYGLGGVNFDVTAAKLAAQSNEAAQAQIQSLNANLEQRVHELAEKELYYRLMFEGVKDYAIFILDCEGRVKSWNTGAEQVTGYKAAEILGHHFAEFHVPGSVAPSQPQQTLLYARETGRFYEEGWRLRKGGHKFWASVAITSMVSPDGKLLGYCKILRDMTEQRRAMSLLIAERQRAELANQAKSTFLASMSHEIRTPMNAILGIADLLSQTELNPTQTEYVERFQRAGSNLLAIINDILDLSRIEAGHLELEQLPFDLCEVAQRCVDLVSHKVNHSRVNLACRLVPGLPIHLTGDPNRLQQILLNLLGNAIKFTEQGEILLTIQQHPDEVPNHVQFMVSDTGIGIPADKLSCIFDDFRQAESSTTRRFGGTGLGLGIARRLVRMMGGKLTVQSEQGRGSTFIFDAVFKNAPPKGNHFVPPPEIHALFIEPNATNRLIYQEICSAESIRHQVAASLAEAEALLTTAGPFSVIVVDSHLLDQTAHNIQALSDHSPLIVATAGEGPGDLAQAGSIPVAAYLTKPVGRTSLLKALSNSLPANQLFAIEREPSEPQARHQPEVRVLVADDSEDNRFLLDAYLRGSQYKAEFTTDGEMAVELFKNRPFDLILMDVQMPKMDGLQATAAIRAFEKLHHKQNTPIIALTASAMNEDVEKSIIAGCSAHLSKPISKSVLLRALEEFQPVQTSPAS